jgi:hypothetical protein
MRSAVKILINLMILCDVSNVLCQTGPGGVGDISNVSDEMVLWLVAQDLSGANGDDIVDWQDRTLYNNDASSDQAIANSHERPSLNTASLNGLNTIDFDQSGPEYFHIAHDVSLTPSEFSLFVVGNVFSSTINTWGTLLSKTSSTGWTDGYGLMRNSLNQSMCWASHWSTYSARNNSITEDAFHIHTSVVDAAFINYSIDEGAFVSDDSNVSYTGTPPLSIGVSSTNASGAGFFLDGEIAEIVIFNASLNTTERLIINNYLSSKYDIALSNNDLYSMDTNANGDHDFDVAGVGQTTAADNHTSSQSAEILITVADPESTLGDGEYLFYGHNRMTASDFSSTEAPSGVTNRLNRIWRISEPAGDVGGLNVTVDLSAYGSIGTPSANETFLLFDSDGDFSNATTVVANSESGMVYTFNGVTGFTDAAYLTIGINSVVTPIELKEFELHPIDDKVEIKWVTATELNNDYFTIERSSNGTDWRSLVKIDGAGSSSQELTYQFTDIRPIQRASYYRLKQTDFNGQYSYSAVRYVTFDKTKDEISIFPNPVSLNEELIIKSDNEPIVQVRIFHTTGRLVDARCQIDGRIARVAVEGMSSGIHLVEVESENFSYRKKIVVNDH